MFDSKVLVMFAFVFVVICSVRVEGRQGARNNRRMQDALNYRQSRFLSLFTFVQFSNQECMGTGGENGTCLTSAQCTQRGGTGGGPCAGGYGICCIFMATCGMTIRENGTYFVNTGYPTPYDGTGSCQITLMKMNADICQYRLDFLQFQLMGPEQQNNICNNDQFIVSGGGSPVPPICGLNNGNHMYIDAGSGLGTPMTLSMITSGPSFRRNWKIRVVQIPCTSIYRAEDGCLQYYTGVAGQIMSFNYDPANGLQLSNQDYGICIRTERNFCGIQYTQCPDTVNNRSQSFTLSGNTGNNNQVPAMVGSTGTGNFCQNDYLIIPMASNVGRPVLGQITSVDRICGGTLSADVTLNETPVRSKSFKIVT
ncbi:PREDICTED: uncharacterized protein LOC108569195 [Nicrophorus vespilloides]|uniref:Uncharacterized protein LOC108569195 n=1 Tax=Nicrophorus vespilloides TaxID=110193 RepID=A0ABM1NH49_NICVS|nr:PREDICTED: uncharacterized protein LOC108569195 [Nicrophorus vespilloides]